ncbi:MAG TPA: hypothetical protein VJH68_01485 [Candidatus Nanoarchaeia archaeon]|nr:hypothetical protein [Candidatus Nanoarchaeia archaeon]
MADKDLQNINWGEEVDKSLALREARNKEAERKARERKIVQLRKLEQRLQSRRRGSAPQEVFVSERQRARIEAKKEKEDLFIKGILVLSGQQHELLDHLGIRAFISIMRSEGLLGSSLEKSLQNLFIWLSQYQKISLSLGDKSQRVQKGQVIAKLRELQKKINTQIGTVQAILGKADQTVDRMRQNLRVFIDDEDKLLSLLRRNRGKLSDSELPVVTKTALRYLKREVLPTYKDLTNGYKKLRENITQLLENIWKKVQAGKEVSLDAPLKYYQITIRNINEVLAAAERNLEVNRQEEQYLKIIENLAIKIASSSDVQNALEKAEPTSVRVSQQAVAKPRLVGDRSTQKAYAGERLSIAQPAKPEKKWYKPWTWLG